MANPMVPIIEKMQDTFIYTLENPVEYDFVKNSKYIDFEQIETDDYNQYLTSTVTVNPNLVYVSEVREAIEYNDFLFVAKQ
jgi:Tfp pilus assembly pilus retraction ATPase PilT